MHTSTVYRVWKCDKYCQILPIVAKSLICNRVARLAFCRPNTRNLAFFGLGWPVKFESAGQMRFGLFFGLFEKFLTTLLKSGHNFDFWGGTVRTVPITKRRFLSQSSVHKTCHIPIITVPCSISNHNNPCMPTVSPVRIRSTCFTAASTCVRMDNILQI